MIQIEKAEYLRCHTGTHANKKIYRKGLHFVTIKKAIETHQ